MADVIQSPFAEAIESIIGVPPPFDLSGVFYSHEIDDENFIKLQDWCSLHARPAWATGISMVDAADHIVKEAVANSNIVNHVQVRTNHATD